jgi:hypothetical protein
MNIGFDLDRVFINTPPFIPNVIIEKFYRKKANGVLLYRIPNRSEQILRSMIHHPLLRRPIKKNLEYLETIAKDKHNLYLISSRFGFLKKRTNTLVKTYHLDKVFHDLYFNFQNEQPHIFKSAIIKEKKLDAFVDDDLPLLKYAAKLNPSTKFYWLNAKIKKQLGKNIFAITHLSDIVS